MGIEGPEGPPPITLTGGGITVPPTSWFYENVVPYLQGEEETKFLNEFLEYAKQLQSERVGSEEGDTVLPTLPMLPKVPEDFIPSTDYLSIEFSHLIQLIDILKTADPELLSQLEPLLAKLQTVLEAPPSADLVDQMSDILSQLNELAQQVPLPYQDAYVTLLNDMYQTLTSQLNDELMDLQNQATTMQNDYDQYIDPVTKLIQQQEELRKQLGDNLLDLENSVGMFQSIDVSLLSPELQSPVLASIQQFTIIMGKLINDFAPLNEQLMITTDPAQRQGLIQTIRDDLGALKAELNNLRAVREVLAQAGSTLVPEVDAAIDNISSSVNAFEDTLSQLDELKQPTSDEIMQASNDHDTLLPQIMELNAKIAALQGFRDDIQSISSMVAPELDLVRAEETVTGSYYAPYEIEINALRGAISILIEGNPALAPELNQYLAQLNAMDPASLTDGQLQQLDTILSALNERVEDVPTFYQATYWDKMVSMINDAMASIDDYNTAITFIQDTIDGLPIDDPERKGLQDLLDSLDSKTAGLQTLQDSLGAISFTANLKLEDTASLPDLFRKTMLVEFMPTREAYLQDLADQLYFVNKGAEYGNQLLDDTIEFQGASDNYTFASYLQHLNDEFSGDWELVNGELQTEKDQAHRDLLAIDRTLSDIDDFIGEINNDPQLADDQKMQLIDQLNVDKGNLMAVRDQLPPLIDVLDSLTVSQGTDSSHFTVSSNKYPNWATLVPQYEGIVQNGDSSLSPGSIGGLTPTHQQIAADQQQYSDQSQNQQMILQLQMTEIQQEWTIVSTSLQLLNQMYTTVARGIYK